ncbi:MAG: hypothetical protein QNJ90_02325 [Planctomycetota bacterium]|nr:hypothetical protein [Planctomycetota bacterium]
MSRKHPPEDDAQDLRAALDLWREDAARTASSVDVNGDLADRVVAAAEHGRPFAVVPAGARWYAAAAVLLIAVGVAGTFMVRRSAAATTGPVHYSDIQETLVNVVADDPKYAPGLEGR